MLTTKVSGTLDGEKVSATEKIYAPSTKLFFFWDNKVWCRHVQSILLEVFDTDFELLHEAFDLCVKYTFIVDGKYIKLGPDDVFETLNALKDSIRVVDDF